MADITIADLTEAKLAGSGVYDVLMRATKAHLEAEYTSNRINGKDYATVYLGSMESVLQGALQFLLQREKIALEASLLEKQILLAEVEVEKAGAQLLQIQAQTELAKAELAIVQANALKVPAEIDLLKAQTDKVEQETLNAVTENLVLQGQKCKLDAEYDLLLAQKLKGDAEIDLLTQKTVTERAQTSATGVDPDSVVGRQKGLYLAQTNGFVRDAEQKAAKIMADTWNVRRTTDEGTSANTTNQLDDSAVGRAVAKLLSGVGA